MYFNTAPEVLCMTCKTDQFKKQKDYIQVEKKIQRHQSKQN